MATYRNKNDDTIIRGSEFKLNISMDVIDEQHMEDVEFFCTFKAGGKGIRTRNLNYDHTGYSQPHCGEYLEQYFDTVNNVWKTWNGSAWV